MKSFRFLHTADLHLGTPFRGLPRELGSPWSQWVTEAADNVARRIVKIAIEEKVDFVTIAGDLFDTKAAGMYVQFELMRAFESLEQANIPVFISHGNHDPLQANRFLHWPANVHVFPAVPPAPPNGYEVQSAVLRLDETTRIQISGFSYSTSDMFEPMSKAFVRLTDIDFAIGLYHGMVGQSEGEHVNYCPAKVTDLLKQGFDFWGLGHIHQPQVVHEQNPTILYPGNPQGRHIRENGLRGCSIVDVTGGGLVNWRFVPVSTVMWEKIKINVDGYDSIEQIRALCMQKMTEYIHSNDIPSIIRFVLVGQTEAHAELTGQVVAAVLAEEVEVRHWPIYVEQVDIQTMPAIDEDVLLHSDSYAGSALRQFHTYQDNLAKARTELLPGLEDVFHAANGLSLRDLTDEDVAQMLMEAKQLFCKFVAPATEVEQ